MSFISVPLLALALGGAARAAGPEPFVIGVLDSETSALGAGAASAAAGTRARLRFVDMGDPWRDGAAAVARLLSAEPDLLALLAPADATAAHVAAQAGTRLRVPVLTLSPEGSLTRAKDPWVFRAVPDDQEQAAALLRWAFAEPRGKAVFPVVPGGREGRERLAALRRACRALGVREAGTSAADAVMLWLDEEPARTWLSGAGPRPRLVMASIRLHDRAFLAGAPPAAEGLVLPLLRPDGGEAVAEDYAEAAGWDMVRAVLAAAAAAGATTGDVRRGLAGGGPWQGRSGRWSFGKSGERRGGPIGIGVLRRAAGTSAAFVPTPSGAPR